MLASPICINTIMELYFSNTSSSVHTGQQWFKATSIFLNPNSTLVHYNLIYSNTTHSISVLGHHSGIPGQNSAIIYYWNVITDLSAWFRMAVLKLTTGNYCFTVCSTTHMCWVLQHVRTVISRVFNTFCVFIVNHPCIRVSLNSYLTLRNLQS